MNDLLVRTIFQSNDVHLDLLLLVFIALGHTATAVGYVDRYMQSFEFF